MPTPNYPSRFSRARRWLRHLFINDALERPVQIPELNEVFDFMDDRFKQLGDAFFRNGDIKQGLAIVVNRDLDGTPVSVSVSTGQIWVDGLAYDVTAATIPLSPELQTAPEVAVGIKVAIRIVDETDDPALRDPVANTDNFGMPGAHRLAYETAVVLNDETAYRIGTLRFGELVGKHEASQFGELGKALAARTYDSLGHFTLEGFEVSVSNTDPGFLETFKGLNLDALAATVALTRGTAQTDADLRQLLQDETLLVTVGAGKAYPLGYPVHRTAAQKTLIRKAKDVRPIAAETHRIAELVTGGDGKRRLKLFSTGPVASVSQVEATLHTTAVMTRSGFSWDSLPSTIDSFVRVSNLRKQQFDPNPLQKDVVWRYSLQDKRIEWLPGHETEVAVGDTYYVDIEYKRTLMPGAEYTLDLADKSVVFAESSTLPLSPDPDALIEAYYAWYVDRIDLVGLNQYGENHIETGQSAQHPLAPAVPDNILPLAYIRLSANAGAGTVQQDRFDNRRLTTLELRKLLAELDRLRYEQALTNLNNAARLTAQSIGIMPSSYLVDLGVNLDRLDLGDAELGQTPCAVNPQGWIQGAELRETLPLTLAPAPLTTAHVANDQATLPFTVVNGPVQPYASEGLVINPLGAVTTLPTIRISPDADFEGVSLTNRNLIVANTTTQTTSLVNAQHIGGLLSTSTMAHANAKRLLPASQDTLAPRTITVKGAGFPAEADNLEVRIADQAVDGLVILAGSPGTVPGTLKATATGVFEVRFTIPTGVPVGIQPVTVGNPTIRANALYKGLTNLALAQGLDQGFESAYTASTDVDAVAMLIQFADPTPVHGLQLFFETADTSHDVVVEVREAALGVPTRNVVARARIPGSALAGKASADASLATTVQFEKPFVAKANESYAVTVRTTSATTALWVARIGSPDKNPAVTTGAVVPPFTDAPEFGSLLYSPSRIAWQADRTVRFKLALLLAEYSASQHLLQFEPLGALGGQPTLEAHKFRLGLPPALETVGTRIAWEYSTNNTEWTSFDPQEPIELGQLTASLVLRARLFRMGGYPHQAPVVPLGTPSLVVIRHPKAGNVYQYVYPTKLVQIPSLTSPVNRVQVQLDVSETTEAEFSLQVGYQQTDGSLHWLPPVTTLQSSLQENGWSTLRFAPALYADTGRTSYKARVIVKTTVANPAKLPKITNLMVIAYQGI